MATELVYKEESYAIIGACFEVYNEQGCGFLEAVYQESLDIEFNLRNIPVVSQPKIILNYKEKRLKQTYQPDYVCFDKIILEIKAVSTPKDQHRAQVYNYLKSSGLKLGLLVNFGRYPKLEYERIVR